MHESTPEARAIPMDVANLVVNCLLFLCGAITVGYLIYDHWPVGSRRSAGLSPRSWKWPASILIVAFFILALNFALHWRTILSTTTTPTPKPVSITQVAHTREEDFSTWATVRFLSDGDPCPPRPKRWNVYACFPIHDANDTFRVILVFDHPLIYEDFRLDVDNAPLDDSLHTLSADSDWIVAEIFIDKKVAKTKKWIRIVPRPWTYKPG